jgi:hypothetical protein
MHILQEFVLERIDPLSVAMKEDTEASRSTKRRRRADFFESFLWLHLGAEIGAFPFDVAATVYTAYFEQFFSALNAPTSDTLQQTRDIFRSQLYVYDTPESRELKASFPNHVILIEKAMRGEDILRAQLSYFSSSGALRPLFNNLLFLSIRLAADRAVRRFVEAVQFFDEKEWDEWWDSGKCDPDEIVLYAEGATVEHKAAIAFAGYLTVWRTTYQFQQLFESCEKDYNLSSDDRFKLSDRVRDMVRWRMSLTNLIASQRFDAIASRLKTNLDAQARKDVEFQPVVNQIKESFDKVFQFWLERSPAIA